MTMIETYMMRASGVARLDETKTRKAVSLPMISALRNELPPLPRRYVTTIAPRRADKEARIALIRACHRKAARSGMFDHCEFQL